ncbi:putative reverse transcriptase domain-containing protein [Tanacetum coccineum]|uniref:Reverse transcriptase domain-containing protein n=1 Tax=Tanacetum coccineum TaxID=301880 RepID=A0ABQ5CLC2_9ASTR
MPLRMRTRSAVHVRRGNDVWVGRGGRGRRPREGNDERVDDLNGQGNNQEMGANRGVEGVNRNVANQGNVGNQNGNVVNENVQENVGNMIVNCNRVVLTCWIEKMEYVQDISGYNADQKVKSTAGSFVEEFCPSHEMQKLEYELWNHAMVGAGHVAYTDRFHKLARLVPHLVTPKSKKIERYISGALTDEAVRNGSIKKVKKKGNVGEPSKDKNGRDDNKRTRTGNAFATTANPDYRGVLRNVNPINTRNPTVRECYECGSTDHVRSACPRLNRAQGSEENRPNQVATNNKGQGRGNLGNQARGRAFMLGAEEAHQDPNIVTGTFTLNNHFATTLFDSGVDYNFVSTTFMPLLGIEPSKLGFKYKIEIASRQLVEIDKVIKGCKLEIEGYVFDIDLIPFGHGSFDVIIGMDWLSNYKAKIIYHEKVVRIPLSDGKVLRVLGERPEGKAKLLMSPKASDKKQEEIVVVRDFPELDPSKIEDVKNWKALRTLAKVRSFLGLAGYYHRFIENFSKIAKSLTILTQKCKTFDWRQLKIHEKNYTTYDLELDMVVFALKIWRYYLYRTKSVKVEHQRPSSLLQQPEIPGFVMENNDGMNKREAFNVSIQYEHGDDLAARMQ